MAWRLPLALDIAVVQTLLWFMIANGFTHDNTQTNLICFVGTAVPQLEQR